MGWLRARLRFGACAALVALALNLALSFGHHHFDQATPHDIVAIEDAHRAPAGDSDDDHHGSSAAHPCFACIVLTAAALAAGPLVLPARASPLRDVLLVAASLDPRDKHRTSFEARAPPLS